MFLPVDRWWAGGTFSDADKLVYGREFKLAFRYAFMPPNTEC